MLGESTACNQRLKERMAVVALERMRECTFRPDTTKPAVRGSKGPPVIPSAGFTIHGQASSAPCHQQRTALAAWLSPCSRIILGTPISQSSALKEIQPPRHSAWTAQFSCCPQRGVNLLLPAFFLWMTVSLRHNEVTQFCWLSLNRSPSSMKQPLISSLKARTAQQVNVSAVSGPGGSAEPCGGLQ